MNVSMTVGRRRHSAEEIVSKLATASELRARGLSSEQTAAQLGISVATLYNWRRSHGEVDGESVDELDKLRKQNARLRRALTEAELMQQALRAVAMGKF